MRSDEPERFELPPTRKGFKTKVIFWIRRFLPAEITGSVLAIIASYSTIYFTCNKVLAAYAGAVGDTGGFYLTIIIRSSIARHKQLKRENQQFSVIHLLHVFKGMVLEFGPAEVLDSIFLRPYCMYIFPVLIKNYSLGILVGKIASDISFYIPVIISHEVKLFFSRRAK